MSDSPGATGTIANLPAGTVHSAHYKRRQQKLRAVRWPWPAMVVRGVQLTLSNPRNLMLLLPCAGFVIAAGTIFYLLSLLDVLVGTRQAQGISEFVKAFLHVDLSQVARIGEFRLPLWQSVFIFMFRLQLFYLLIVIGQLGSGLIANDLKTKALPIYFSRPITPLTYLLGKWLTIAVFIAVVMLLPNLLSLGAGILFAGMPGTLFQTMQLAGYLVLVGVGVMIIGGLLILALSSLTSDKRFVIVGWLAIILLPHITQQALYEHMDPEKTTQFLGSLSLSNDVVILASWLFGLRSAWEASGLPPQAYAAALGPPVEPLYPAIVLLVTTVLAATVCVRRVVRFSQSASSL